MKANLKFVWLAALLVAGVALAVKQVKFSKLTTLILSGLLLDTSLALKAEPC
jgi:hypothetical protein